MKISIDTKEDSHEEIKKVISMLQNLVGGRAEIFTNDSSASESLASVSPMANIFGDTSPASSPLPAESSDAVAQDAALPAESSPSEENAGPLGSTDDLFAELFSPEDLKKMEPIKSPEDEEEEQEVKSSSKAKSKRPEIEFY